MAGPARGSSKKAALRSSGPSTQATALSPASPGTAVASDQKDVVSPSSTFTALQASQTSTRTLVSRLSQTVESSPLDSHGGTNETSSNTTGGEAEALGAGVKDLISTMNELEKLGFSNLNISLAKCVVCGDQSAGKSSVIEAISGIKVPRAAGTCTRCPIFVKLDSGSGQGSSWHAKVCIRKGYTYLPDQPQQWGDKFVPWVKKPAYDESTFAETSDQHMLGQLIYWAQLAILNPKIDPKHYVPGLPGHIANDKRQTEFSPNVVCVYISAPELPDLSFFDLPGVIITRGNRSKEALKKFIEDLVSEYIEDPNSLVLLTSSLEVDWELASNAADLVAKTNATDRCVGVLTKPDRIDNDSRFQNVLKALDGQEDRLGHGYFVVKQPAQDAINGSITHQEARQLEEHFFDEQEPWAGAGPFASYRHRFGTLNLQKALSDKLAALSLGSLPGIWEKTTEQLTSIEDELSRIPRPPSHDITGIVRDLVRDFADIVRSQVSHEGTSNLWRLRWDTLQQKFASELQSLRPKMETEGSLDRGQFKKEFPDVVELSDDEEDGDGSRRQTPVPATPRKRKLETPSSSKTTPKNPSGLSSGLGGTPRASKRSKRDPRVVYYNLDDTRVLLRRMSTTRLDPDQDQKAVEGLMLTSMKHCNNWSDVLSSFFSTLKRELLCRIIETLDESLSKWSKTLLYREMKAIVEQFIEFHYDIQRTTMGPDTLNDELVGPYGFDRRYFDFHKDKFLEEYKKARIDKRRAIYFDVMRSYTGKEVSAQEQVALAKKDPLKGKLANDPYDRQVDAVARIRAYYELAAIRFQESICMRVESQLFKKLGDDLFCYLRDDLQITGEDVYDRCTELLAEDSEREKQRRDLEDQKARLVAGRDKLRALNEKYKDNASLNGAHTPQDDDEDEKMEYA